MYALQAHHDQVDSLYIVIGMLQVFDLDDYALFDPGATFILVTPYMAVKFGDSPNTLC